MPVRRLSCLLLLAAASCSEFPADPDGTLERIREQRVFRVGLVRLPGDGGIAAPAARLLQRVGQAAGARPRLERGEMEVLLHRLEEGEIDLVIGRFEAKSPWTGLVSLSPPLHKEKSGKAEFRLAAAMRNGENAWIGLVEREARAVAPEAQ
jgi:hypothetical protein